MLITVVKGLVSHADIILSFEPSKFRAVIMMLMICDVTILITAIALAACSKQSLKKSARLLSDQL